MHSPEQGHLERKRKGVRSTEGHAKLQDGGSTLGVVASDVRQRGTGNIIIYMLHTTGFGGGRKGCGGFQCIGAFGVGGFALSGSALNSAAKGWASGEVQEVHPPPPRGNLGRRHHQGGVVPHSPLGPRNRHCYTCASAAEGRG